MDTTYKQKWQKSNRWLVLIDPSGYMTVMRADSYKTKDNRYKDFKPFAQIRNANNDQINWAMVWAIHNLKA